MAARILGGLEAVAVLFESLVRCSARHPDVEAKLRRVEFDDVNIVLQFRQSVLHGLIRVFFLLGCAAHRVQAGLSLIV